MVGTILNRVLSRNKTRLIPNPSEVFDEKHDYPSKYHYNLPSQLPSNMMSSPEHGIAMETKPTMSSLKMVMCSPNESGVPPSPRKQSYASIKEDSEALQSFSIRRASEKAQLSVNLVSASHSDESAILADDDEISEAIQPIVRSAGLETVPDEILDQIFSLTTLSIDKDRWQDPKVDLFNLLFVSKAVHAAALRVLYRHIKIPQSKAFFKLCSSLTQDPRLGELVQCLDFSHFSNIGFGRAKSTNNATPYLTSTTLKACLDRTPKLKAFLVHEHVDDDIDAEVLSRLFTIPSLRALDLCACSSTSFSKAMNNACENLPQLEGISSFISIERLSLHECTTLRPEVFRTILPRLHRVTHLDVAHTMIDDKALLSIPPTARITHLNLGRCTQITGAAVVEFLTNHPGVKDSIVYLNLQADASRYRLLSEDDLTTLLPLLPTTLRSLNIGGARINSSHVGYLQSLSTHIEELGLKGADLSLSTDIRQILSLDSTKFKQAPHTLRYIDLTDIKSVNQISLTYSPTTIIDRNSAPLEVIELGETLRTEIEKRSKNIKNPDWVIRELGRRGWYVRQEFISTDGNKLHDDGHRQWKMGAQWWGMKKIPMFAQATGGMYGYFMFKKA